MNDLEALTDDIKRLKNLIAAHASHPIVKTYKEKLKSVESELARRDKERKGETDE